MVMKKFFLLTVVTIMAIFIDGTLTHDIFAYRLDSFPKWATIALILGILVSIALPKTNKNKNLGEKKRKNSVKQKAQSISLKLTDENMVCNKNLGTTISKNANDYFSFVPLHRYFLSLAERAHFLQIK